MRSQSIVELILVLVAFTAAISILKEVETKQDYDYYRNEMGLITLLNEEYDGFSNAELLIAWSKEDIEDGVVIERLNSTASQLNDHYLVYVKYGNKNLVIYDLYPCVRSKELHVAYMNLSGIEVYFTSWSKWQLVEPC